MKTRLIFIFFLPCFVAAQNIALIDRALKMPMTVTQQLSVKQLSGRLFPVYTADLDSVIKLTEKITHYVNTGVVQPDANQIWEAGNSQFTVITRFLGRGNSYTVFLSTRAGAVGASLELVKPGAGNRATLQQLYAFLDYLKNNRHIAKSTPF